MKIYLKETMEEKRCMVQVTKLEKLVDINRITLYHMLSGHDCNPRLDTLMRLKTFLNCSWEELLEPRESEAIPELQLEQISVQETQ